MKRGILIASLLALTMCSSSAMAAFRLVRTGVNYATFNEAMTAAANGDTIEIDSGTYIGAGAMATVASNKSNITVRGVGATRPILDANFGAREDKGILVVYGTNTTVENIEFRNARSSSGNGAGIRGQGNHITVRNCRFYDCQDGILGGGAPLEAGYVSNLLVEYSEFDSCGNEGYAHGMYISNIGSFTLRHCWMHRAKGGHEIKSRAGTNYVLYNRITNEGGVASYEVNIPNGGTTYIIGNIIEQSDNNSNSVMIDYLSEGTHTNNPNQNLYVINNTIVNNRTDNGVFVKNYSNTKALVQNNIFQGPGTAVSGQSTQVTNWATNNAFLQNAAGYDFRLTAASVNAINAGTALGVGVNGFSLTPVYQYVHPCGREDRPINSTIDIGAYEYVAANQNPTVNAGTDQVVYEGRAVALHATGSDPDNDTLVYAWTQTGGKNVSLAGGSTADVSFTAPTLANKTESLLTLQVQASDGKGGTASDTVNVQVYMKGDATRDHKVNVFDLQKLASSWNKQAGQAGYDAACDFTGDNKVNVFDLQAMASNWNKTLP